MQNIHPKSKKKNQAEHIDILTSINMCDKIKTAYKTTYMEECEGMGYREDVKMIKALADENRLAVLEKLQSGEKCACVLLEELNITQSTLSHHMKLLCDSGLVEYRKEGKWMHYSISKEGSKAIREMLLKYTSEPKENCECCNSCK